MPTASHFCRAAIAISSVAALAGPATSANASPSGDTRPAARTITVPENPPTRAQATPQQAGWLKAYDTGQRCFEATLREGEPDDDWRFVRVVYPSPVKTPWPEANVVPCELYLPRRPAGEATPGTAPATGPAAVEAPSGRVPAAVVLDILDGSAVIPRGLARGLAERGVAALYVPMACYGPRRPAGGVHFKYYADHPEATPDNLRQTVMDVRRAKALLAALPEVDPDRIGITGVSLGGIMTALAAGVDGEFYRVAPILAGGDVAGITFHARETRRIKAACDAHSINQAKLAAMLAPVEPLSFASRIDPSRCLMINAAADEVIPAANTAALRQAVGQPGDDRPRMLTVPVGHYAAMLYLPNIRRRVVEFMQGKPVDGLDFARP